MKNNEVISPLTIAGNAALLQLPKTAFLAPGKIDLRSVMKCYDWAEQMRHEGRCVISGFSSKIEKDVLSFLLKGKQPIILVLGRRMYLRPPEWLAEPLADGRIAIVSVSNETRQSRRNAQRRNFYVASLADEVVFPSLPPATSSLRPIYDKLVDEGKPPTLLVKE